MANSVHKDRQGPDWPLGNIVVVTPGTQVSIMSLVDPNNYNDPSTQSQSSSPMSASPAAPLADEYTVRAQQIIFQAFKAGAGPPRLTNNTGNIYIVRKPTVAPSTTDVGTVVAVLTPGQTFVLASAALDRNVFSPYRYFIDADTAADACQVTLVIQ